MPTFPLEVYPGLTRVNWYNITAVACATFKESVPPDIGIVTS
jgi:hypothetical protein